MRRTLRVAVAWFSVSLVLTGCGVGTQQKNGTGVPNPVAGNAAGKQTVGATGNKSAPSNTVGRSANTTGTSPAGAGAKSGATGKSNRAGGGSAPVSAPIAFSKLGAGPLLGVWFAPTGSGTGGQTGYVADEHHLYLTGNGGKTWTTALTATDSILGMSSDLSATGQGVTALWAKNVLWLSRNAGGFSRTSPQFAPSSGASGSASKPGSAGTYLPGTLSITQASAGGNTVWLLAGGGVYRYSSGGTATATSAPGSGAITAIAAVDSATCYAVAKDASIYKTTNGGVSWNRVFWPPLNEQLPWRMTIQATGNHVAVMYFGGDSGVGDVAYILITSNNGGNTWTPLFDEPGFSADYGDPVPAVGQTLGKQPGPFTLLPSGNIVFLGANASSGVGTSVAASAPTTASSATIHPVAEQTSSPFTLSVVSPGGTVLGSVPIQPGNGSIWPDPATAPVALDAPGGQQVFLAGGATGTGVLDESQDGGLTWHRLT